MCYLFCGLDEYLEENIRNYIHIITLYVSRHCNMIILQRRNQDLAALLEKHSQANEQLNLQIQQIVSDLS